MFQNVHEDGRIIFVEEETTYYCDVCNIELCKTCLNQQTKNKEMYSGDESEYLFDNKYCPKCKFKFNQELTTEQKKKLYQNKKLQNKYLKFDYSKSSFI